MEERRLYHGSRMNVNHPEIRQSRFHQDFSTGFYCTELKGQAIRWATRYPGIGYVNEYAYTENPALSVKHFATMTEEWLDFIVACRTGISHEYDIVEGPMADDTIFSYVQDFLDGKISREAFWVLAKFKKPTHQICFHTARALQTLSYVSHEQFTHK